MLELLLFRIDPRADLLFFCIGIADDSSDDIRSRLGIFDRAIPSIAGSLVAVPSGVRDVVPGVLDESANVVEKSHRGLSFVPTLRGQSLL
jgi:hypothetical protein